MNSQSLPIQYLFSLLVVLLFFSCNKQDADGGDISSDENLQHTLKLLPEDSVNSTNSKSRSKEEILAYFDGLIANKQLIVGQHCGEGLDTTVDYYNRYIDVLADHTGRHVALMGADLGFFPSNEYPVQALIDYWNKGGLVTVSWHADNPFTDGYNAYCNTAEDISAVNLRSLLKDASRTTAWTNYRTALDNIAGALQKLRDAGVTVIWRPFHEMNGDFFWWGINAHTNQQTNAKDYKSLWIDLYNTLTVDYGLDNLIWTYAVMPYQGWNAEVTAYYAGSDYVDLVGMIY